MSNSKIKVAVVCGGMSNEREVSKKSGEQVFANLPEEKYDVSLIEISREGRWLERGSRAEIAAGAKREKSLRVFDAETGLTQHGLKDYDVLFLALHGRFGEDGRIQSVLDMLGVTYTGSGVLASALGMDKIKTSHFVEGLGVKAPASLVVRRIDGIVMDRIGPAVAEQIKYPCIVKPNESGSSVGISKVETAAELEKALNAALAEDQTVIIQEFVPGREITCGVMGNTGQGELLPLPPVEVIAAGKFFDYEAKYISTMTQEICPAQISAEETKKVQELAQRVHTELGCDGLTRSDFILKDGEFYFLEINTLPGLTQASLCPKEAKAAGLSFGEFLSRIVELALRKNR